MTAFALISVIDDVPSVRTAIDDLLKSGGYTTNVFCTAEDFLCSSALWESDCVISDVEMPGKGCVELLRFLRSNRIKTPLIVMSARRNVSILGESENLGAFAFVEKPFSPERFLDLVNLAVRQTSKYRQMTG